MVSQVKQRGRRRTKQAYPKLTITINGLAGHLRQRFEKKQTDYTFTVLALLPTATENILGGSTG
ncbi:hypothetical protein TESG_08675 [Trichophyton tonsurans CBS 112818]|uniref:Peroxisomal membrane protein n=2 Tax=Trichophyton TaxID=5550 RepID=F2PXQ0_TRIEC|nr:hypothetical protein TESG_08675 [Trichophyton tonsurans CBS 112818]EGE06668.1 peroxisomal membrane protein [Trichophyton equinum CBS 127.97]